MTEGSIGEGHFLGERIGDQPNVAHLAANERRVHEQRIAEIWTCEPAVVVGFDFATQRVDARCKNDPESPTLYRLPVRNTGGRAPLITPIAKDSLGWLWFPRSDSTLSWESADIVASHGSLKHAGLGAFFDPAPPRTGREQALGVPSILDANGDGNLDAIGPSDVARMFLDASGNLLAYYCLKSTGEFIIKASPKVFIGLLGTNVGTYPAAARVGDSVPGGSIGSGSATVFIG